MRVACIDIGSNTSVLLIAYLYKNHIQVPDILEDQIFFTRLAEGFFTYKQIQQSALDRQKNFFKKARHLINQYGVKQIKCVATAVARTAQNQQKLLQIAEQYGFDVEIISGEVEAKISRKGALFNLDIQESEVAVLDIGGASTEISTETQFFSLPIGSVNLTEEFISSDPPSKTEITLLQQSIQKKIDTLCFPFFENSILVATAGTPTTLACLKNKTTQLDKLHGSKIHIDQIQYWKNYLFSLSCNSRKNLKGMPFYRADVMPTGLSILKQIMQQSSNWNECVISVAGLRYGLLYEFNKTIL